MAWNSSQNKGLRSSQSKNAHVGLGAPVSYNPANVGRPYRDSWDIERAYKEGFQKVTWVSRCIDAIAGNQSRLPAILRADNSPQGRILRDKDESILSLLNTKTNVGENSFVFRYRLSSQLLMSSRGAFIEKVRGRNGELIALQLLPPQHTAPIPDPRTFVSGFEVDMRNGTKIILNPDDVVWIRKPHPLDPYLSLTPMEAAGIAIEIENLAKIYNRNFLLNDGRPGGLLVVRGEIDDDDKDELRNRFRGNINRAGAVTVVSSDEGVDFVDTGQSPRDANYVQMRQLQKEEILAAFGVPESVIGNAAGRTFSNAAEEHKVFWNETMLPHLELLARGLDELHPKYYVDFDVTDVPVLVLYKQERDRYLLNEFQQGLISGNEYREGAGRKNIDSELMDAMLANPNLTPIGYTNKKFDPTVQQQVDAPLQGAPGAPQAPGVPPMLPPATGFGPEVVPQPAEGMTATLNAEAIAAQQAASMGGISGKSDDDITTKDTPMDEWATKAEESSDRWTEILDSSLERYFERQQRVILEKASGNKSKKGLEAKSLDPEAIFDIAVWNKQMNQDMRPILSGIMNDAAVIVSQEANMQGEIDEQDAKEHLDSQMERFEKVNSTTAAEIAAAVLIATSLDDDEDRAGMLQAAVAAIFVNLLTKRRRTIAEHESQTAFNAGTYYTGRSIGAINKTWISERDPLVRPEHVALSGKSVGMLEPFRVGDDLIRFPGDPFAPPHLTINCRCRLRFDIG